MFVCLPVSLSVCVCSLALQAMAVLRVFLHDFSSLPFSDTVGLHFEHHSDIGVFAKLTNAYCLIAESDTTNFYSAFEAELRDVIPVIYASIGNSRVIGRLCAGNKHGLLVPNMTTDQVCVCMRILDSLVCVGMRGPSISFPS